MAKKPKLNIGDNFDQFTSEPKQSETPKAEPSKGESKETPVVAFRLPENMKRNLDNFSANTGYSKTEIIIAGLRKVFEANPEHLKEPKGKPEIK